MVIKERAANIAALNDAFRQQPPHLSPPPPLRTPKASQVLLKLKINMEDGIKIYKPKKDVMGGGLVVLAIVFFGLTLPVLVEGAPVTLEKLVGLAGFWTFGIILTAIPFMFKLEVGADYIKSYFLGFCIRNLHASDIQALEYGNLMRWGSAGYGKGHKGWGKTRNEGVKYFSMGENFYGREAIEHVRQVLDPKNR